MAQAAQDGEALADGVAARTEPLVGQRLPAGKSATVSGSRKQRRAALRSSASRVVAVTASSGLVRPGGPERTSAASSAGRARRDAHVDGELLALGGGERGSDAWVAGEDIEQVAETHGAVALARVDSTSAHCGRSGVVPQPNRHG